MIWGLLNFVRAAVDYEISKYLPLFGGVNKFFHFRAPTLADNQPTIRMNRDTLHSVTLIDISKVFYGGGEHKLDMDTFDTPYVLVALRTLVDSSDPADVQAVNDIQDAMEIKAASAKPYILPNYDIDSFE